MTVAATIATAPLMAHHFGSLSLAALPANLLALPAVAPAMWLGMLAGMLGQLPAVPVEPLNWLDSLCLAYIAQVARWFGTPGWALLDIELDGPAGLIGAYAALIAAIEICLAVARRRAGLGRPALREADGARRGGRAPARAHGRISGGGPGARPAPERQQAAVGLIFAIGATVIDAAAATLAAVAGARSVAGGMAAERAAMPLLWIRLGGRVMTGPCQAGHPSRRCRVRRRRSPSLTPSPSVSQTSGSVSRPKSSSPSEIPSPSVSQTQGSVK